MAAGVSTQPAEQPLLSPRAELKAEKSEQRPRSHGVTEQQRELVLPGIVDFKAVREALRIPQPHTPGTYRFGRLSHHSFFARHHPHPQHVTHIPDITGHLICAVRDNFSLGPSPQDIVLSRCLMGMPTTLAPVGDPQSNRDPRLSSEAWKKELKDLASQVVNFTKENEPKNKEQEEPQREQGAKYSAETGRLIPASSRALRHRHFSQGGKNHPTSRDGGVQTYELQDQELLEGQPMSQHLHTFPVTRLLQQPSEVRRADRAWGPRFTDGEAEALDRRPSVAQTPREGAAEYFLHHRAAALGLEILELLSQILQTDSLSAIQCWLLCAPPKEKDLALGLLQTAVAQLFPQALVSIPTERLLTQLQEAQEPPQEKQQAPYSQFLKKSKTSPPPKSEKPEHVGKAQVLRVHLSQSPEEKMSKPKEEC